MSCRHAGRDTMSCRHAGRDTIARDTMSCRHAGRDTMFCRHAGRDTMFCRHAASLGSPERHVVTNNNHVQICTVLEFTVLVSYGNKPNLEHQLFTGPITLSLYHCVCLLALSPSIVVSLSLLALSTSIVTLFLSPSLSHLASLLNQMIIVVQSFIVCV